MKNGIILALGLALIGTAAHGQINIINDNLDAYSGPTPGYTFGDVANATRDYTAGAGVGGSVGAVITSDFTPPGVGYGGVAYQYQSANTVGNTSASLGDYTLSFDALVNKNPGGFTMTFQAWTGTGFSGTFSESAGPEFNLATPNVFQHFSINLGTFNPGAVPTGGTLQIAWQMNEYQFGGPGTGNQMIIDNVVLTLVPEPTAFALVGLGAATLLGIRRRRA
jgi:hypothetical protein